MTDPGENSALPWRRHLRALGRASTTPTTGSEPPVKDWVAWHAAYDDPLSSLSTRLRLVRGHLSRILDEAPAGPVRLVSLCAGQGLDVLGVLPEHPRGRDVSAVLVEFDPHNAALARQGADEAGLSQVEVRAGARPLRGRGHRHLDQAPPAAGPDAAHPRVVPRERVRGGGLRHAGHRGADGCRRRPGRRPRPGCRTARCSPSSPLDFPEIRQRPGPRLRTRAGSYGHE